jgi:hypothetical protein
MQKGKSSISNNRLLDDTHSNAIYTATLKGKINGLEETVKALTEELTFYKNEIGNLRSEKNDLEQNLAKKTSDIRNGLARDVMK